MKARIKFTKTGSMKFIGHLDVMRYFQKAFRRADIDIAYSQGFNRHQLMSFALPLGVGLTSDGEYLDVQLNSTLSDEEMVKILNEQLNDEMQVVAFHLLSDEAKNAMSIVAGADYGIFLKDGYQEVERFKEKFDAFLSQDSIIVEKKTKKSTQEVDIRPFIYASAFSKKEFGEVVGRDYEVSVAQEYSSDQMVFLQLSTGSVHNLKPDLVMEAFCKFAGVDYEKFAYQYHRYDLYADVSEDETTRKFVSLEDLCEK